MVGRESRTGADQRPSVRDVTSPAEPVGNNLGPLIERRRTALLQHPGFKARTRWEAVERVIDVHGRNGRALVSILDRPRQDVHYMLTLSDRKRPNAELAEFDAQVDQHLHNYVASTKTLVDHTRHLARGYKGTSFSDNYERRLAELTAAPVVTMFNGLRNYVLHAAFPWTVHQLQIGQDGSDFRLLISTDPIIEAWRWGASGKQALIDAGGSLDLLPYVEQHGDLLRDFYGWLAKQHDRMHAHEYADLEHVKRRFAMEFEALMRGTTDE